MTVKEFADRFGLKPLSLPEPDREVQGGYCGALLSWVMGRAGADAVWITIMSNVNTVAVASLSDVSCVVLAEGVTLEDGLIRTAEEKGVNVLTSDKPAFTLASEFGGAV